MGYWLQRISIIVVASAGMVLAPIVCLFMLQGDYIWLGAFAGVLFLVLFLSQDVRNQWTYVICSLCMSGTLNFLPVNFSIFELTIMMVFSHFFLSEVIFKKRGFTAGNRWMLIGISIVGLVVCFHWFKEGIGFKLLGGGTVGARKSLSMMLGVIGYFIVITLCRNQWKLLNRLPWIYFGVTLISSIPFFISTVFPSLGPRIFAIYGDVNADAYMQGVLGDDTLGRVGKYANIAATMEYCLLAYFPVKDWWRPNRWWVAILWIAGLYLCMSSGYRSTVFGYLLAFVVGSFISSRFKSIVLWIFAGFVMVIATVGQGNVFELPLKVQRALSFLPGKWDTGVVMDASSSDDFRAQIQGIYLEEFAHKSPWIGGGFNYDAREVTGKETFEMWDKDPYNMFKGFIIRKDYHIGWISLYDTIGVVGAIGFCILFFVGLALLLRMFRMSVGEQAPPILIWLAAIWIPNFVTFFSVFGAIQGAFPLMCVYGALITCSYNTMKDEWEKAGKLTPTVSHEKKEEAMQEELLKGNG